MDVLHTAKPRVVRTWGICVIYSELCTTSNFTFLRGASHPEELVTRAADLGLSAIAITDHNSLAGVVRAYAALKELRRSICLLYTSPSPRDLSTSRMPSSA